MHFPYDIEKTLPERSHRQVVEAGEAVVSRGQARWPSIADERGSGTPGPIFTSGWTGTNLEAAQRVGQEIAALVAAIEANLALSKHDET
ncbi:MAG: hypothetical protein JO189_11415 [Deltaproteobacteria bacterium]|nr:hypothetical protein [Deltaproteobacteria bacterium]